MSDNPTKDGMILIMSEDKERKDGEITIEELKKGASDSFAEIMAENARKKEEAAAERHKHNEKVKREYRLKGK